MSEIRALVVADAEGIIRMWSSGAEALFGYPAPYALGRSLELLIPERFRERHWRAFHAAMATGVIELDEVITPTVHADGTEVNHVGRLGLLKDREGATMAPWRRGTRRRFTFRVTLPDTDGGGRSRRGDALVNLREHSVSTVPR